MARRKPRALHLHVLAALGLVGAPGAAFPYLLPDGQSLAAVSGACTSAAPRLRGGVVTFIPEGPAGRFVARGAAKALTVSPSGPEIAMHGAPRVAFGLLDAAPGATARAECDTGARTHSFVGSPDEWRSDLPHFSRIRYEGVRPGVDVVFYGREGAVEYDFIAHPGSDPSTLAFAIDGGLAARVDAAGDLVVDTAAGEIRHRRPIAYQLQGESVEPVDARFAISHDAESDAWRVGFVLGDHDPARALVIDPVLAYSTFLGATGSTNDNGGFIGVDASGNVYLGGNASSSALGGSGSVISQNVEIFKFDPVGNTLLYSTVIGGSGSDSLAAMHVDGAGNVYLAGSTSSADFPRCLDTTDCAVRAGSSDAFVMRLDASGVPNYSFLLGGSATDSASGIAVDGLGRIHVTGTTTSADFPVAGAPYASFLGGSGDAFVTRVVPGATGGLHFSTYLGGSATDGGGGIALDSAGNMYITGNTNSLDFPLVSAAQSFHTGGANADAFLTKMGPTGTVLFSTFLGGSASDFGLGVGVDPVAGDVLVVGSTGGGGFPATPGAPQMGFGGGGADAFAARFSTSGGMLASTFLGGSGSNIAQAVLPDGLGGFYVGGQSAGPFDAVNPIPGAHTGSTADTNAFIAHYRANGAIDLASLLGSSGTESIRSLAAAPGALWAAGATTSPFFPTRNAVKPSMTGSTDFFATRFTLTGGPFDFNADGKPDLLWSNTSSGATFLWTMNGLALQSDAFIATIDPSWKVQGVADFNADGKFDLVWRNTATGNTYVWYLDGAAFISDAFIFGLPPEWVIQGVADFNRDGHPDFLMRNTNTGVGFAWYFNNAVPIGDQYLFGIDPAWKVEGVGDFSGDGQPDLLFRNMSSGLAFAWNTAYANGVLSLAGSSPSIFSIDPVWEVVQVADWNGDGQPDLLFRNRDSGVVFTWYLNGTTLAGSDFIIQIDPSWEIVPRR